MITGVRALFLAAMLAVQSAPALAQSDSSQPAVPKLKNGQFVWLEQPELIAASTAAAPVSIVIGIAEQRAYVFRGGRLIGATSVSTGSSGRETPTGEFTILQKKEFHRSNLYSDAPMPYMQRLTWDGIALHAGHLPGYPASHGCIRLPAKFAKQLYDLTALGGTVTIAEAVYDMPEIYAPLPSADPGPTLTAETRDLGGGAFDVLTMSAETADPALRSASWVAGSPKTAQPAARGAN
ncbi:L,D-transpeptidase family protein [Sphingomonas sp. MMS12-HWE2-04]|uniref:L,D-transpeptidase family protein n=1 Tax=Sphingomonas sp. MMS12-HWE2-04 TaxID=3234199 RepID=UPI0038500FB4